MQALDREITAKVVTRVDKARHAIKVPAASVYHTFVHKLDEPVRVLLDNIHLHKRVYGGGTVE